MSDKDLHVGLLEHCKRARHNAGACVPKNVPKVTFHWTYTIVNLSQKGGGIFNNWISFTCVFQSESSVFLCKYLYMFFFSFVHASLL